MTAVDTNILVYAHREDSEFHRAAELRVRTLAESPAPWAIPWPCIHEFFAIVTNPRLFPKPTPAAAALEQVDAWLQSPSLVLLTETGLHWPVLRRLIEKGRVNGALVHDARIAALCLQHGANTLVTMDRDFSRFRELKTVGL